MRQNPLMTQADIDRHKFNCCKDQTCRECGSHVSGYNCNDVLLSMRPEAKDWDWWLACDNADCQHARGEGLFQRKPDWVLKK